MYRLDQQPRRFGEPRDPAPSPDVPEGDRLYLWMLVKNLDMPNTRVAELLCDLGVRLYGAGNQRYVRKSDMWARLVELSRIARGGR